MAVSLAHSATQTGSAVTSITVTVSSTTAGSLLAIAIGYDQPSATVTVTDNKSQTWTYAATQNNGVLDTYIYIFPNTNGGVTSVTVTFSVSVNVSAVYGEFSGMGAGSVGDPHWYQSTAPNATASSGATSVNIPANALALATADELLLTMVNVDPPKRSETFTVPSNFSSVGTAAVSTAVQVAFAWEEDTASDKPSPTWSWNNSLAASGGVALLAAIENKSGSNSYTASPSDTLTAATDSASRYWGARRGPSESNVASDSVARLAQWFRHPTESNVASDNVSRLGTFFRALSEPLSAATDAVSRFWGALRNPTETNVASDAVARLASWKRFVTDTLTAAVDSTPTVVKVFPRSVSDALTAATDSVSRLVNYLRSASESNVASDAVSRLASWKRSVTDTLTSATDSVSASSIHQYVKSVSDTLSAATDAIARLANWIRNPTESHVATDSVARLASWFRSASEALPSSDAVVRTVAWLRSLSEGPLSYSSTISADSPVSWWRLDDTGSTAVDQQGLNNGTLNGGITTSVAGATADGDAAMSFDGSTGYIAIPASTSLNGLGSGGNLTVELWAKYLASSPSGAFPRILAKGGNGNTSLPGWCVNSDPSQHMTMRVDTSAAQNQLLAIAKPCNDNAWHHYVWTIGGSTWLMYRDGLQVASATLQVGSGFTNSYQVSIGALESSAGSIVTGNDDWLGSGDEIAVYNVALSASQVMAHYLAGTGGASDLVSRLATLRRTMADTMSAATDSASRLYAGIRSAAETLSTSDAVSRVASWFRTIGETLSIQDSVQTAKSGANNYARAVTEALSNSDAVARAAAWLRSLTEGPQSYVNTISADSPIAWWRLDDTGTTAVDQIAAHNGTLNGGVTTGVAGATADGDAAMSFDGSTGYISIPDTAGNFNFSGTAPFSVEVWLYPTVASPTYWMRALTREQSSPRDGWELLAYKGTGASGFARYAAGTGDECTSGNTPLPLNHWNYCVGTYDGTNMRWYVNGVLLRTLASSRSISSLSLTLDIGAYSGGQLWNGGIDEVALYNYALSGSQVVTHYLAGAGGATDFVTRVVSVFRSITDTLSAASDGVARLYNGIRTATESLSVSDVVARLASYRRSIADTLSAATDSVSRIYAILRNATESVTASDAVSRLASWFRSPSEALSSSDAVARVAGFRGAAADTLSAATDSVAKLIGYVRTGAEALSTSDTVARLGAFGRGIADALGAAVDAVVGLFRTFANPGTVGAFDYPVYMVSAVDYAAAFVDAVDYATATVAALDSAVAPATPYATVILRDNPVGYWRLDDAGSTVVDQLGLYNGTLTGNVTEGVAGALPNDPDKAMEFGGTTGYIDMGNVLNFGTGSFTVEYWVNLVALPNNPKWHLGKGNPYADATAGWSVATWDTTNQAPIPACYISDGVSGHGTHANVPSGATRGTWAHIVFVIDRNAQLLRAAINGVESSGSNISGVGSVSSALPLRLGQGNGNPFWGGLDEVALYNYALSAEQIASHYAVGQQQAGSVGAFDYPVDTVQAADLN